MQPTTKSGEICTHWPQPVISAFDFLAFARSDTYHRVASLSQILPSTASFLFVWIWLKSYIVSTQNVNFSFWGNLNMFSISFKRMCLIFELLPFWGPLDLVLFMLFMLFASYDKSCIVWEPSVYMDCNISTTAVPEGGPTHRPALFAC